MNEEQIKADAEKVAEDTQAAQGWIKTHIAVLAMLGSFVAGAIVGHFLH